MTKQICNSPLEPKLDRLPRDDLIGREFTRLRVVSYAGYTRRQGQHGSEWWWWCTCSCDGHEKRMKRVGRNLLKQNTKSCGCLNRERKKDGPRRRRLICKGRISPSQHHESRPKNAEMPWDARVRLQSASFEQALQGYGAASALRYQASR